MVDSQFKMVVQITLFLLVLFRCNELFDAVYLNESVFLSRTTDDPKDSFHAPLNSSSSYSSYGFGSEVEVGNTTHRYNRTLVNLALNNLNKLSDFKQKLLPLSVTPKFEPKALHLLARTTNSSKDTTPGIKLVDSQDKDLLVIPLTPNKGKLFSPYEYSLSDIDKHLSSDLHNSSVRIERVSSGNYLIGNYMNAEEEAKSLHQVIPFRKLNQKASPTSSTDLGNRLVNRTKRGLPKVSGTPLVLLPSLPQSTAEDDYYDVNDYMEENIVEVEPDIVTSRTQAVGTTEVIDHSVPPTKAFIKFGYGLEQGFQTSLNETIEEDSASSTTEYHQLLKDSDSNVALIDPLSRDFDFRDMAVSLGNGSWEFKTPTISKQPFKNIPYKYLMFPRRNDFDVPHLSQPYNESTAPKGIREMSTLPFELDGYQQRVLWALLTDEDTVEKHLIKGVSSELYLMKDNTRSIPKSYDTNWKLSTFKPTMVQVGPLLMLKTTVLQTPGYTTCILGTKLALGLRVSLDDMGGQIEKPVQSRLRIGVSVLASMSFTVAITTQFHRCYKEFGQTTVDNILWSSLHIQQLIGSMHSIYHYQRLNYPNIQFIRNIELNSTINEPFEKIPLRVMRFKNAFNPRIKEGLNKALSSYLKVKIRRAYYLCDIF